MEKRSAKYPTIGVIMPPTPKASPIMRLETIDLPLGASSWPIVTVSGRMAMIKKPEKKAVTRINSLGRAKSRWREAVARRLDTYKMGL
jgi:hypothetical protein